MGTGLVGHIGNGARHFFIGQGLIAAFGRHHATVCAAETFDCVLNQHIHTLCDARCPLVVVRDFRCKGDGAVGCVALYADFVENLFAGALARFGTVAFNQASAGHNACFGGAGRVVGNIAVIATAGQLNQ